jgi:hypothetical protein
MRRANTIRRRRCRARGGSLSQKGTADAQPMPAPVTRRLYLPFFSISFNLLAHFSRRRRCAATSRCARSTRRPEVSASGRDPSRRSSPAPRRAPRASSSLHSQAHVVTQVWPTDRAVVTTPAVRREGKDDVIPRCHQGHVWTDFFDNVYV